MSKRDEQIEQLEAERDHWRRIAHQRAAENADLLRQIERLTIHAGVLGIDSLKRYDQAMAQLQLERDQAIATINVLLERYGQVEITINPPQIDPKQLENITPESIEASGGSVLVTENPLMHVGYVVAARNPIDGQNVFIRGYGLYPDSLEQFREEAGRFQAIIWRAPMPEDFRGMSLLPYGVSEEQQLAAIQNVSIYWHDDNLKAQLKARIEEVYDLMIAPHCKPGLTEKQKKDARDTFRRSVQATFKKMSERRQMEELPKLSPGKTPRSE